MLGDGRHFWKMPALQPDNQTMRLYHPSMQMPGFGCVCLLCTGRRACLSVFSEATYTQTIRDLAEREREESWHCPGEGEEEEMGACITCSDYNRRLCTPASGQAFCILMSPRTSVEGHNQINPFWDGIQDSCLAPLGRLCFPPSPHLSQVSAVGRMSPAHCCPVLHCSTSLLAMPASKVSSVCVATRRDMASQ